MGKEFMGVERTTFIIDEDGMIKKIFLHVNPEGHSIDVLNCLESV